MVFQAAGLESEILVNEGSPKQIIKNWIENDSEHKFVMKVCILWNIWKSRNDIIFSHGSFSVQLILKKASQDFDLCMENLLKNSENSSFTIQTWLPPEHPFIKINVDATFIPNNGAAGVVDRDYEGRFLGCVAITFMETSPLLEESVACRLGVELGKYMNIDRIIIEGDALNYCSKWRC
ncbi:uncharacterized protein LOC113315786 [Papaver somniferum]|uniref:uncharacterized protein LOC113315786 n=1 Tax=Papaver somniferum TaxID=3469 RepID=UPI000E6FA1F7|nr:uncharacterized protein LOC113315786 [Papaver somniferum]